MMLIANITSGLVHILIFFRGVASLHFILDNLRELEPDSLAAAYLASRLLLRPLRQATQTPLWEPEPEPEPQPEPQTEHQLYRPRRP